MCLKPAQPLFINLCTETLQKMFGGKEHCIKASLISNGTIIGEHISGFNIQYSFSKSTVTVLLSFIIFSRLELYDSIHLII